MGSDDGELHVPADTAGYQAAIRRLAHSTADLTAAMRYLQARFAAAGVIPGLAGARNTTGHGEHVISPADPAAEPELPVVPGSVTGYRWWTLPSPDWTRLPSEAEQHWPHGRLHGVQGDWVPGVNTAVCSPGYLPQDRTGTHPAPAKGCYCGFWAYWQPEHRSMMGGGKAVDVFGVIRAWGRVRLATRGFRAEKARILAVHMPLALLPDKVVAAARDGWYDAFAPPPWREPAFETVTLRDGQRVPVPPGTTLAEAQAAADYADAWAATAGDRLETDYGVRVFETRDALLASFPPDPVRGSRSCRYCGGGIIARKHHPGCPEGQPGGVFGGGYR